MEGLYTLGENIYQLINNYIVFGWFGTVLATILISYVGKVLHKKLPQKNHRIWSAGVTLSTTFIIFAVIILQGGASENWMAAVLGLNIGVYYIDKVDLRGPMLS